MKKLATASLTILMSAALTVPNAAAVGSGGFENASFSGYSLSQANAVVARPDEPAAISYNPAGIADLPGIQVQSDLALINLFTFYDGSSVNQPDTRSSGTLAVVPTAYLTVNPGGILNDRLAFGVGSDSPFGLANKYDSTHPIVRYSTGAANAIKMYTIKPVVAFKVTDKINIGAGPMWYRIFSLSSISQYPNRLITGAGAVDGQYRFEFSGQSWGWHLGAQYKPTEHHQFGFYFRSPVHVNTRGTIEVENSAFGGNFKVGGRAKLNLPLNMTWAYAWQPTEKTSVEVDFGYTHWGGLERAVVHNDPAASAFDNLILGALGNGQADWANGYSIHIGGEHKVNDKLTLRSGASWYSNSVPDDTFRPNVPDSNSLAVSLGLGYDITRNLIFDLAYYNRFWLSRHVDNSVVDAVGQSIDGDYWTYAQEALFSVRYFWDGFGHSPDMAVEDVSPSKK